MAEPNDAHTAASSSLDSAPDQGEGHFPGDPFRDRDPHVETSSPAAVFAMLRRAHQRRVNRLYSSPSTLFRYGVHNAHADVINAHQCSPPSVLT